MGNNSKDTLDILENKENTRRKRNPKQNGIREKKTPVVRMPSKA